MLFWKNLEKSRVIVMPVILWKTLRTSHVKTGWGLTTHLLTTLYKHCDRIFLLSSVEGDTWITWAWWQSQLFGVQCSLHGEQPDIPCLYGTDQINGSQLLHELHKQLRCSPALLFFPFYHPAVSSHADSFIDVELVLFLQDKALSMSQPPNGWYFVFRDFGQIPFCLPPFFPSS